MSYRVLVITEDFTQDQYIVKPLVEKIFQHIGKKAKVIVCHNPRFRGIKQCTNFNTLQEKVIRPYQGMIDLFLLLVDRDNDPGMRIGLDNLETQCGAILAVDKSFVGENAWQEVEVWAMAGQDLPEGWSWDIIRRERDVKEHYYVPLAKEKGLYNLPHQGRERMMQDSLTRWNRMLQRCPEDLQNLISKIESCVVAGQR